MNGIAAQPPFVSVIVPCRDEERHIAACLDSIVASGYPRDRLEVLVVDGRSRDGTREIVATYARRYTWIRLLDNPQGIVPVALNAGIRLARGQVIVRMDAHVVYPPTYLPDLVTALQTTGADNVGGRVITLPDKPTAVARAVAIALSHPFGVGNSYFRIGASAPRWVDTVPFGCYRREVFDTIGLFDEELARNQDDEFNHRLIQRGGRVLLLPAVVSHYYARGSLRHVARMFYQYGVFKPLVARKVGRVMTIRQLVPPAFVAALGLAAPLALWWRPAAIALGLIGGLYVTVVAAVAGAQALARRADPRVALALIAAFPAVHLGYGFGFLRGLWRLLQRRARYAEAAALPLSR